jgi:hypothetical protein
MDKQLDILENKIEEKTELDKKKYYEENIAMFNITKDFIKNKNLLLYGGLALNLILPPKSRFYDEYEVPDYDFFSPNAIKHGKELANIYARRGYKDVELKPGLHLGTYKLFVSYTPIADITNVPPKLFRKMMEISSIERDMILKHNPEIDLQISPLDFLRLSMHLELSRPNGFIERWKKVYSRMVLLYKTYPLKYESCFDNLKLFHEETDEVYLALIAEVKEFLKINQYPVLGSETVKMYLKEAGYKVPKNFILDKDMTAYDLISETFEKTTKELSLRLSKFIVSQDMGKESEITIQRHASLFNSELIPGHFIIRYNNKPLVCIYQSEACYAYKERKALRIATIDTSLSLMYAWLLSDRDYYVKDKIKCAINILLNLQKKQLNRRILKNKIFSPFEIKCYGYQMKLEDLKKKRYSKNLPFQIYKPK